MKSIHIQMAVGVLALIAAATQCYYLLGISRWTTNMQPLTATLYILFFWILWGYARIGNFIQPLLKTSSGLIKLLAAISVVGSALLVVFIGSASDGARIAMMKFGVLNGVIMACYLLIAIVSIFGDKWLGFVARILKMGREFPRNRRARL